MKSLLGKVCLVVYSISSTALLSAACVTNTSSPGCVHYAFKTAPYNDQYTYSPSVKEQQWFQNHVFRILGYEGYWNSRLSWFPNSWVYRDISALYNGDSIVAQHPEWVLHDQYGSPVYINYACSNGTCPQYAPDFGNAAFRQWWIGEAAKTMAIGYKGLFVDDVNLRMDLTNGTNGVAPIDPATGQPMTGAAWEKYQADFCTQIRKAFPNIEIVHNSLWFAGNANPDTDPYVSQQLKATNYINIERGFADGGLTGDGGFWSIQNLFTYIDKVHARGAKFVAQQYWSDGEFALASYFLVNNGLDLFMNDDINPTNWPAMYDVNLGQASGARYNWNGLIRRDFANGMALINPPNAGTVTVALPDSYVTTNGTVISSITLNGREGAVLTKYAAPGGPVPDGTYTLTNGASGMVLDDPGVSMAAGTEMIQWPVNGGSNQAWKFVSKGGGYYTIQNGASGLYLTSTGSSGSTVQQQKAASSNSQLWSLKALGSSYMIVNRASSLALDDPAASTQQGAKMIVWGQHGGTNQQWTIH